MTYTKDEARTKIAKLVEDFRAHEATLEKAAEAQIENNFDHLVYELYELSEKKIGIVGGRCKR